MMMIASLIVFFCTLWFFIIFTKRSFIKNRVESIWFFISLIGWNLTCFSINLYISQHGPGIFMLRRFVYINDDIWIMFRSIPFSIITTARLLNIGQFLFTASIYIFICYLVSRAFKVKNLLFLLLPISIAIVNDPNIYIVLSRTIRSLAPGRDAYLTMLSGIDTLSQTIYAFVFIMCVVKLAFYYKRTQNRILRKHLLLMIISTVLIWASYQYVLNITSSHIFHIYGDYPRIGIISLMRLMSTIPANRSMVIFLFIVFIICASFFMFVGSTIGILKITNYERLKDVTIKKRLTVNNPSNMLPFVHTLKNETIFMKQYMDMINVENYSSISVRLEKLVESIENTVDNIYSSLKEIQLSLSYQNVSEVIESAVKNLCIPDNIHLKYENKNIFAMIDAGFFCEAIQNLIQNSIDACADRENSHILIEIYEKGRYVEILFRDNGVGVQTENLDRVFDPFFSTKSNKSSWGLGLSHVSRVVYGHSGQIEFSSEYMLGTTVTIRIPSVGIRSDKSFHQAEKSPVPLVPIFRYVTESTSKIINKHTVRADP